MTTTGPYYRAVNIPGLSYTQRTWYRQKPRLDIPLPYQMVGTFNMGQSGYPDPADYSGWSVSTDDSAVIPTREATYQKCYNRFVGDVHAATAQLGADFAERKQSINALTARTLQLARAARALRRGRVLDFFKELGIKRRTVRKSASDMGQVWLEYSYGWKPLVEDIYSAVNVLQRPFPFKVAKGRAQGKCSATVWHPNLPWSTGYDEYTWSIMYQIQARVSVSNWVAWRANELGLINPLSVAWEVVPFSFVVDWFIPIGNYLQNLTDFVGLNLEHAFNTLYRVLNRKRVAIGIYASYKPYDHTYFARRVDVTRVISLPSPPVLRPRFTGFYSARGANAIALLTSTLKDLPNVKTKGRTFKMSRDMYNWERNIL